MSGVHVDQYFYSRGYMYCDVHSTRVERELLTLVAEEMYFFFSSRRRHTRFDCDWSSDVCSSDLRRTIEGLDDGTWQNSGESVEWARAIAFGWQDLEIVNGAPLARRSFIDGFAGRLYPVHLKALIEFRQLLARRNRLLQQRSGDAATRAQLEPWNDQFATVGMDLVNRRRRP